MAAVLAYLDALARFARPSRVSYGAMHHMTWTLSLSYARFTVLDMASCRGSNDDALRLKASAYSGGATQRGADFGIKIKSLGTQR